jgi:NADH dehydrogenase (ubiquinone) 1 alpha subcomplex subunit 8
MLDNLKIERPYFGYFSEVKVHHTERPRPEVKKQEYPDAPLPVPDDLPLQPAKFGKRSL